MAEQMDARGMLFQINTGTPAAPTWAEIEAITEFKVDRSEGEEEADTTTFASQGVAESEAMQRGATCELTARRKANRPTETNPGQATPGRKAVELLAEKVGVESKGQFRFRHVWETEWEVWTAWAGVGETSGETNDKTEWECTFHKSGPKTMTAVV